MLISKKISVAVFRFFLSFSFKARRDFYGIKCSQFRKLSSEIREIKKSQKIVFYLNREIKMSRGIVLNQTGRFINFSDVYMPFAQLVIKKPQKNSCCENFWP